MKKYFLFLLFTALSVSMQAQDGKELIAAVNKKFLLIKDYKADVDMKFNLPGIKLNQMSGKVYYKNPNKFRIVAKGIFFLPKNNPMKDIQALLAKTSSYTSVISGYSTINGKKCAIINVIPLDPNLELVIGKFWISTSDPLIYLSEITTKQNGTLRTKNTYGSFADKALPDKIEIEVEMKKFKIPKMLAADIKKNSVKSTDNKSSTGTIQLSMKNYKINSNLSNDVFVEK